jgi:hypothetical protein
MPPLPDSARGNRRAPDYRKQVKEPKPLTRGEAERLRRTPQANGRRQERRGTERSPALGGGLTLVVQDGQDAYQRVFADVGHGTRGFPASVAR